MATFLVGGKVVDKVELFKKKPWFWSFVIWPFVIFCLAWWFLAVDGYAMLGAITFIQLLLCLLTVWFVDFNCFAQYSKVKNIHQADYCKITPARFCGSKEVVPLMRSAGSSLVDLEEIYFEFRKHVYVYSKENGTFDKLSYPTKETFGYYLKSFGHDFEHKVDAATKKWGRNVFDYPQPTFHKLMKEHCMQPFFVFQVICVGVWLLDEYWYHSLFTLFMLVMVESSNAKIRLKTLTELGRVRVDYQTISVYRAGRWRQLPSTDLLPGDVVSIGNSSGQNVVPADMLILAGSAITNEAILTGESTPQWKVSIAGRGMEEKLSVRRDKTHILYCGTTILQHTSDKLHPLSARDGDCLAVVLRTGFETSQGKLMRTILFSTEMVTADSWESGLFILFLVVFALIAAGYVFYKELEDPSRCKYRLILNCSLIVTSVIPPELAAELSIAVYTSLNALARREIFCTEPFRMPFAGKVDICCFDKTGTLTSDDMEFSGVVGLTETSDLESDMSRVPGRTVEILASCHALVIVKNQLVGDPLEKATLTGIDWSYKSNVAFPKRGNGHPPVQIIQRYHFASHLKRMAVVVRIEKEFFAFVKGAPEIIQDRLINVPPSYVETYKKYTRQGSRVLALAHKSLSVTTVKNAKSSPRDVVESELTFAGFMVFNCPIRSDSAAVLSQLKESSHDLVMITGDQALTACHVASQVNIISEPILILCPAIHGEGYSWVSPDEKETMRYSKGEIKALSELRDLCVGGDCFEMLQQTSALLLVIPYVKVFARVAPEQKELILRSLKTVGRVTLMCGDGTNDVGALKQAHVGVALLNAMPSASEQTYVNCHQSAVDMQRQKLKKMMDELNDGDGPPIVKLGDASKASSFTAKRASVAATADIIRQGRSTLVTTHQIFKITGLHCLSTVYVLSVMYLDGVNLGDVQTTISGVFTAGFLFLILRGRPLPTLSTERPHPNIFSVYFLLSLLGQFFVHLYFLMTLVEAAKKYMPKKCIEPNEPNMVNTVSFTVSMLIQGATFTVNYMGHPFNQSIIENKPFCYALIAAFSFFIGTIFDLFRHDWLLLVPLPVELRNLLLIGAFMMFFLCYSWERLLRWAFLGKVPAWKRWHQVALEKKSDCGATLVVTVE